jgi:hypothetical protein
MVVALSRGAEGLSARILALEDNLEQSELLTGFVHCCLLSPPTAALTA